MICDSYCFHGSHSLSQSSFKISYLERVWLKNYLGSKALDIGIQLLTNPRVTAASLRYTHYDDKESVKSPCKDFWTMEFILENPATSLSYTRELKLRFGMTCIGAAQLTHIFQGHESALTLGISTIDKNEYRTNWRLDVGDDWVLTFGLERKMNEEVSVKCGTELHWADRIQNKYGIGIEVQH